MGSSLFIDRRDGGVALATALRRYERAEGALVLGLGRGGLAVAAEVGRRLSLPVEVFIYWHLRCPGRGNRPIGVVTETGTLQVHRRLAGAPLPRPLLDRAAARARARVDALRLDLRAGAPLPSVAGRTVLLVSDGSTPGPTLAAAIADLRAAGAGRIVLGMVAVAVRAAVRARGLVEELVSLQVVEESAGISWCYVFFGLVSTPEAARLLAASRRLPGVPSPAAAREGA